MNVKKILCMLLCMVLLVGCLTACNNNSSNTATPDEPSSTAPTNPSGGNDETGDNKTPAPSSTLNLKTDVSKYVTLGDYKGVEYVLETWHVTDEDVKKNLNTAFPEYPQIKEGKVKDGDNVNITFIGYVDGKEDPQCTYDDKGGYNLTIGSDAMIDGFEDGIIGQEIGKEFELKLKFPSENYAEDYLGKDVTFKITVHYVTGDAVYPEVTDALIEEKTKGEYKTVEAYKAYLKKTMEDNAKKEAENKNIANVMKTIIEKAKFAELPKDEIDFYNSYVLSQNQSYANMFGMTLDEWLSTMMGTSVKDFAEYNKKAAEDYVKNKLVLIAICQTEKRDMSDEDFNKRLEADMEAYGYKNLEEFKKAIAANDSLDNWKTSYVLNDLELWLVENGKPVEKPVEDSKTETEDANKDKTDGETTEKKDTE